MHVPLGQSAIDALNLVPSLARPRKRRPLASIAAGLLGVVALVVGGGSYGSWGHRDWAGGHGGRWAGDTPRSEQYTPPLRGMPACRATLSVTGGYVKSPGCNNQSGTLVSLP